MGSDSFPCQRASLSCNSGEQIWRAEMENKSFPQEREQQPSEVGFDFNEWCVLARTDSAAYSRRRTALIRIAIESASERNRNRLNGLQFRVDAECSLAHTPLKACLRISSMMWDSFNGLNEALGSLSGHTPAHDLAAQFDMLSEKTGSDRPIARVIPFRLP